MWMSGLGLLPGDSMLVCKRPWQGALDGIRHAWRSPSKTT